MCKLRVYCFVVSILPVFKARVFFLYMCGVYDGYIYNLSSSVDEVGDCKL